MALFQFVDSISASPAVRLDLNAGPLRVKGDGLDLSPAPVRRAVSSTMLADGDLISAAAWSNRTLKIPIQIDTVNTDEAATAVQRLGRELARERNFLRVQLGSVPYTFRTYFAPDYVWAMTKLYVQHGRALLEIPAEPFAYGPLETLSPVVVTNNPAAGSNGMFLDVLDVKGDVETPLSFKVSTGVMASDPDQRYVSHLAVRRRGTPSAVPFFIQAEAMTLGADTTVQANSALMSGAGSNYTRTTFATTSHVQRLAISTFPAAPTVDSRGTYRVYMRCRFSAAGSPAMTVQAVWGPADGIGDFENPIVNMPADVGAGAPTIKYIDLGEVTIPPGGVPARNFAGEAIIPEGIWFALYAGRSSGSVSLDVDCFLFVPADDDTLIIKWPATSVAPTDLMLDASGCTVEGEPIGPAVYARNASAQVRATQPAELIGGVLNVSPNATNRIFFVKDVGPFNANLGPGDSISATVTLTPSYYPRYLYIRPATT